MPHKNDIGHSAGQICCLSAGKSNYHATLRVSTVFAVARCLSTCVPCLCVSLVHCVHTAEDIVKLLSRPGSLLSQKRYEI